MYHVVLEGSLGGVVGLEAAFCPVFQGTAFPLAVRNCKAEEYGSHLLRHPADSSGSGVQTEGVSTALASCCLHMGGGVQHEPCH